MSSGYHAFVFDFDGVLADSVEVKTEAFRQLYLMHGEAVANEVVRYHRENGGMPRAEKFVYYQTELLGVPPTEEELEHLSQKFSELVVDAVVNVLEIPGGLVFLQEWHGRIPMYIDSASPDKELDEIVLRRGLVPYFDGVFGSDRTKVENLRKILDTGGYNPEKVLFFGDALSDYSAAKKCGTKFMGIVTSQNSPLLRLDEKVSYCSSFDEVTIALKGE